PFFLGLVSNSYNNNLLQQQVQQFRQDVHSRSIPTVIALLPVLRVICVRSLARGAFPHDIVHESGMITALFTTVEF
ncbi:MAG: hypothetical protein LGB54_04760, partial [Sulfurovum sp.]|nr:hypothetical protein [Sulfurovum sp.]